MNTHQRIRKDKSTSDTGLDEQEQQEQQITDLQAKLKASQLAKRDEGLLYLVQALVQVVGTPKRLGIRFVSLVRTHYQIQEAMRWFEQAQRRSS
jgi:hypothetical protein